MTKKILIITLSIFVLCCFNSKVFALTRSLSAGWNLISMPVQAESEVASYVRTHINGIFYKMWAYDGEWKKYNPDIDNNSLKVIKKNSAFWIQVGPNGAQLTVDSEPKLNPLTIKNSGWHLSSFNQTSQKNLKSEIFRNESIKSSHSLSNISKIWGFDQSWKSLRPNDGAGSLLSLEPGMGYWIKAVNTENLISADNPLMIDPLSQDSSAATTPSTFDVKVSGSVIDSLSLAPVGLFTTRVLQLSVLGEDQNLVYLSSNSYTNQFITTDGQFEFWIRGISASLSNKKNLRLIIEENNDYLSTSASITIATSQEIQLQVPMVNLNSNFQASGIVTNKVSLDIPISGVLGSAVTLVTSSSNVNGQVEIVVPAGVQMSDKDGNILTGILDLQATYFSPTETSSLNAFPGGLNNINIEVDGEKKQGYFISGGFTAIEILDQNKTHVKSFSQPISVKMEVPSSTINPETGVPLKANDQFPIWSYAPETGKWTSEGFGLAVGPNAKNNFEITFQTNHLSYYNLDWYSEEMCDGSIEFNVSGDEPDLRGVKELETRFYTVKNTVQSPKIILIDGKVSPQILTNGAKGVSFRYEVYYSNIRVGQIVRDNFCIDEPHKVDLNFFSLPASKSVSVSVQSSSSDNQFFDVFVKPINGSYSKLGTIDMLKNLEWLAYDNDEFEILLKYRDSVLFLVKTVSVSDLKGPIIFNIDELDVRKIDVSSIFYNKQELKSTYSSASSSHVSVYSLTDFEKSDKSNMNITYNLGASLYKQSNQFEFELQISTIIDVINISAKNLNLESNAGTKLCSISTGENEFSYKFYDGATMLSQSEITYANQDFLRYNGCSVSINLSALVSYSSSLGLTSEVDLIFDNRFKIAQKIIYYPSDQQTSHTLLYSGQRSH